MSIHWMVVETPKRRFTADEYQRMGRVGILSPEDRVELIDGEILTMTPIGTRHNACVSAANRALVRAAGDEAIVQPEGSIRLDFYNEPQPDLVLLRPRADFYASRHASAADILLIVEIADSSFEYDRDVKGRLYADSGIAEYWLAELKADVVWRYSVPEGGAFRRVEQCRRGESIAPHLLPACLIAVDTLLIE
jgi:Uma2 family endonuclease